MALALIHWRNSSTTEPQTTGAPAAVFGNPKSSDATIGAPSAHLQPVSAPSSRVDSTTSLDPAIATPPPQNPQIDHFPGAKLVAWTDLPVDAQGFSQRILILETNFKFPLVRMTIQRKLDAQGKVLATQDRELMAADHVLLERAPNISPEAFTAEVARAGGKADPEIGHTGNHLIHFDGRDPAALPKMIEELKRTGAGAGPAEPDFIRQLR